MKFKINLFGTLFSLEVSFKITKKVPKYVTVKPDSKWIYAGDRLKVESVYMEPTKFDDRGTGRYLRLVLIGTKWEKHNGIRRTSTVIPEKDLIPHF